MKKKIFLIIGITVLIIFLGVIKLSSDLHKRNHNNEVNALKSESEERESGVDKQMASWFYARAYPDPFYLEDKYARAWQQALAIKNKQTNALGKIMSGGWNSIGPSSGIGGRILNIAINPVKTSSIYIGSAGGGIWRSYDAGTSWMSVTTGTAILGVPAIIISPVDTNVVYAGSGEVYRYDSTGLTLNPNNTGFSVWKTRGTFGVGIIKSIDGGKTWAQVFTKSLANLFGIQRMKFDPNNNNIVYACATDGLYKTIDAGSTWNRILIAPYVSDVVINAGNSQQIVVAFGNLANSTKGIVKSINGGTSWNNTVTGIPSFQGFIRFDNLISAGNQNTIIASVGVCETPTGTDELYESTDFGSTWNALSGSTHTQWQYWCAHAVAIDPSNPNNLIYGGISLYSFTKPGPSGSQIGTNVHADVHDIKFDPSNANIIYVACDGGIWKSTNGGTSWSPMNNGLAATQFYATMGVSSTDPNFFVGGLQDNGVVYYNGISWTGFPGLTGTDGAACLVNPSNDNNVIASGDARAVYVSTNKALSSTNSLVYLGYSYDSRTAFNSPMAMSKKMPSVVYSGSDNLHKSINSGASFSNGGTPVPAAYIEAQHKTALAMAVSPSDPNGDTLYVSTSPFAQYDNDVDNIYITGQPNLLKSTNGGATLPLTSIKGTLPNRFVMCITFSPTNSDSVFIVLGGFGTSHVYVSPDKGTTWNALSTSGLPDCPFNTVLIDPVDPKIIYVGTDMGVYVSPNRGASWLDFNTGLWDATQVMDLQVTASNQLIAATHGKGAFIGARYSTILSVNIVSFSGIPEVAYNNLKLTVNSENGLSYYDVERSLDGSTFNTIGRITPSYNSNTPYYYYKDNNIGNQSFFYRIKAINNDQSFVYSSIISIKRNADNTLTVVRNPFKDKIELKFILNQAASATINLYESNGRLLKSGHTTMNLGENLYMINDLSNFSKGVYYVEAIVNKNRWKVRLLKN
ncbi:MAG: hypothetical protein NVS1B13_10010 [Flavisolibacter sp.]